MNEEQYNTNNMDRPMVPQGQPNSYNQREEADRVSIGSWIFTIIIMGIPIVNVIYFICLLLGFGLQPKVSLARAYLILSIIGLVIGFAILCLMVHSIDGGIEVFKQLFQSLFDIIKNIRS